jgi:two-component system, OmpR family, sensor histidine kinase QseC
MRRIARSLQARVLLLTMGAAGVLWVCVAAVTWLDTRHELDELLDAHLAQSASLLVAQQAREIEEDEHDHKEGYKREHKHKYGIDAPTLHRYSPRVAFQVFHEGRLALRSVNAPAEPIVPLSAMRTNEFRTVRIAGEPWRVFATRGAKSDILVLVGENLRGRGGILAAILRTTLGPLLLGSPLQALALWFSVRRGLLPMKELGSTLSRRDADDFSPLAAPGAPAEMEPMLAALNRQFERVSALVETERRFIADAAHELRTPLAAIRAQAQVASSEEDPHRRRHALAATIEGCDRAARLAEQLLALSRLETAGHIGLVDLDLAGLVRGVLADAGNAALARGQHLEFDAAGHFRVAGDATLLAVMVRNLVDNAVRYAPAGGSISVSLTGEGARTLLCVADSGIAPLEADLARLGERFFRVPGNEATGSGLGLSIVCRIAQLHNSNVSFARSPSLGGLLVSVSFPTEATGA